MDLADTSALVMGGSSGLGLATATALVAHGVRVVVAARDAERGEAAARSAGAVFRQADAGDPVAVTAALEAAAELAPLRSLVVCAGSGHGERLVGRNRGYDSAHGLDSFRGTLEVNLVGPFNCLRLAATAIARQEPEPGGLRGAIVLTSSFSAGGGVRGQVAYAAAKAGLLGLLLPAARDLAELGIRVNAIRPAGFDTAAFGPDGVTADLRVRLGRAAVAPRRMGRPEEFASLAVHLLTNDYLNATTVDLDAGTRMLPD